VPLWFAVGGRCPAFRAAIARNSSLEISVKATGSQLVVRSTPRPTFCDLIPADFASVTSLTRASDAASTCRPPDEVSVPALSDRL